MKKSIILVLAAMAGALAFTSCNKEIVPGDSPMSLPASGLRSMAFTAGPEGAATKVSIDGLDIKWASGDKIGIFDGSDINCGNQAFTLVYGANTTFGSFTGQAAESDVYYAMYPYAESSYSEKEVTQEEAEVAAGDFAYDLDYWKFDIEYGYEQNVWQDMDQYGIDPENQKIIMAYLKGEKYVKKSGPQRNADDCFENVVLPAVQTVAAGQYVDPAAALMIAKSDDNASIEFKNIPAYVKVTPAFDCFAISIKSNGDQALAGTVTVDFNNGTPAVTVTADGTSEVFLQGAITAGNSYYIAVLPESLGSGFAVNFLTAEKDHFYSRGTENTLNLARGVVTNLGSFETSGTWTYESATSGSDASGHKWQLVAPGLKIATESAVGSATVPLANAFGLWGDDWVPPTSDDMMPLADAKAIKWSCANYSDPTTKIAVYKGIGVLSHLPEVVMNIDCYYWLADEYDADHQYIMWQYGCEVYYGWKTAYDAANGVLYKYTK